MKELIQKINNLSKKRIEYYSKHQWDWFYKWEETYINALRNELEEAKDELKKWNSVYLEDELWDVFWTYICLLNSLEKEWFISSSEKVMERAYKKYTWRINQETWENNWDWQEIKKKQKRDLEKENLLINLEKNNAK